MDEQNLEQAPLTNKEQVNNLENVESAKESAPTSNLEKTSVQPEKEARQEGKSFEKEKSQATLSKPSDDLQAGLAAENTPAAIMKKREEAIDKILSEGLNDIFLSMPPQKQQEFQKKGEETTKKIAVLMSEAKVKVGKIVDLVKKWLKLIPGVNKFFLEQETKLKVDKIVKMKNNF